MSVSQKNAGLFLIGLLSSVLLVLNDFQSIHLGTENISQRMMFCGMIDTATLATEAAGI